MSSNINWDEVIDKKARVIDDYDLGEVQKFKKMWSLLKRAY